MITENINADSSMADVLSAYPGSQRALFRKYHIGGCSSCGFRPDESLGQVCERNGGLDVGEVLAHIRLSHEADEKILIGAGELAGWRERDTSVQLLDVRSREEFEAVHIEGSVLMSQETLRHILGNGSKERPVVIIDHNGGSGLDAAAYLMGHGLENVRCLRGGIDAWAQEVDTTMRRYRLG